MRQTHPLFVSHKTSQAVPVSSAIRRDFLIQATLDAGVRSIDYRQTVALDGRAIAVDAFLIRRDDGDFVLDFVDSRPDGDPCGEGILQLAFEVGSAGILEMTDSHVRREPACSQARAVWRHAGVRIGVDDRDQVLDALAAEGPVPLRSLEGLVQTRRSMEWLVFALACEGTVGIDVTTPLDDRTIVRACLAGQSRSTAMLRYGT